jgi:hypothetical protein
VYERDANGEGLGGGAFDAPPPMKKQEAVALPPR